MRVTIDVKQDAAPGVVQPKNVICSFVLDLAEPLDDLRGVRVGPLDRACELEPERFGAGCGAYRDRLRLRAVSHRRRVVVPQVRRARRENVCAGGWVAAL